MRSTCYKLREVKIDVGLNRDTSSVHHAQQLAHLRQRCGGKVGERGEVNLLWERGQVKTEDRDKAHLLRPEARASPPALRGIGQGRVGEVNFLWERGQV